MHDWLRRMVGAMAVTERITIKLPAGFDPGRHIRALERKVAESHGEGWEIDSIDPVAAVAYATRQAAVTEVAAGPGGSGSGRIEVRLPRGTKPSDGERVAARLEEQHPGHYLSSFEPFLGRAVLDKMSTATARCRGAVAVALGAKAWEVGISARPDGGWDIVLPRNYVPSRHDDKLEEVATAVVGREGWYVEADPAALRASIIPGDPPTFPSVLPYDFSSPVPPLRPSDGEWAKIPLGRVLGRSGGAEGPILHTDFVAAPHGSLAGITGAGKGVALTALMAGALARGWELAVVDAVKGGVDFAELAPFVRPGGWGDDLRSGCAVLAMCYAEGTRRKGLIQKVPGAKKWTDLPPSAGVRPLLIVVDELTSLVAPEPVPKGVPKDSELYLEVAERNLLKATVLNLLGKVAREQRFTGLSLVAATQVASTSTGIPTELRGNLGHKLLLGAKPTDNHRRLALSNPDAVPEVPAHIAADPRGAARGVGVYEFEGSEPGVAKVFFSPTSDYVAWLDRLGVPRSEDWRPTPAQIARHTPSLDDDGAGSGGGGGTGPSRRQREPEEWETDPETGERLSGYARANAARHALSN